MTKNDRNLLKTILKDKERFLVWVDNDTVYVQDLEREKTSDFDEYGEDLIISLFEFIGIESSKV